MSDDKHMLATWPELGITVEIEPNKDGSNRWIYDWYYDHLPFDFLQLHSTCTGKVFYTWFPIKDTLPVKGDREVKITQINTPPPGNIGNVHFSYNIPNGLAGGKIAHVAMFYGECWEDMPGYISGRVVDRDLPKLVEAGNAIARALYRNSPVLILDEPSSSLDADSEYEIFSDLDRIINGRTCIFISHRLANVRDADRIVVLDKGRISETGSHDELMEARGRYYSMFTRQKSMYR